jgi:hypothetical protein
MMLPWYTTFLSQDTAHHCIKASEGKAVDISCHEIISYGMVIKFYMLF